jgi:hypothetical protein
MANKVRGSFEDNIDRVSLERQSFESKLLRVGAAKTPKEAEEMAIRISVTKYCSILKDFMNNIDVRRNLQDPSNTMEMQAYVEEMVVM